MAALLLLLGLLLLSAYPVKNEIIEVSQSIDKTGCDDVSASVIQSTMETVLQEQVLMSHLFMEHQSAFSDFEEEMRTWMQNLTKFTTENPPSSGTPCRHTDPPQRALTTMDATTEVPTLRCPTDRPVDCLGHRRKGANVTGIYEIYPNNCCDPVQVLCDMETDSGGWTVVLARGPQMSQEDFSRNWDDYKEGFGNPVSEYWIGNDVLHQLTGNSPATLRIETIDHEGSRKFGEWRHFSVENPNNRYQLHIGEFQTDVSTIGDCMTSTNSAEFTTWDNFQIPGRVRGKHLGCYTDNTSRILKKHIKSSDNMTPELCLELCMKYLYIYSGVQYATQCFCGNEELPLDAKAHESECSTPCKGDPSFTCGGTWRMNVYDTGLLGNYLGCYVDKESRILKGSSESSKEMTPLVCIDICRQQGYSYAGVQYKDQCYCGNEELTSDQKVSDDNCNMECAGDDSFRCGGTWRMNVFTTALTRRAKGQHLGCYIDTSSRILKKFIQSSGDMTPNLCMELCSRHLYVYAGVQYAKQCFCGNEVLPSEAETSEDDCATPCSGDPNLICGGTWRMNVYEMVAARASQDNHLGCYADNRDRILKGPKKTSKYMTPSLCLDICSQEGYVYAGVQYASECFCGNEVPPPEMKAQEDRCSTSCTGYSSFNCGGTWFMNIYKTGLVSEFPGKDTNVGGWWRHGETLCNPTGHLNAKDETRSADWYTWDSSMVRFKTLWWLQLKIQPKDSQSPARMCQAKDA